MQKNEEGKTPLMIAAGKTSTDIIAALLEKGENVNAKDMFGNTALMMTAVGPEEDVEKLETMAAIDVLLKNGAIINVENNKGMSPLMLAAKKGNRRVVDVLLENGAEINAKNKDGKTSLMFAADKGDRAIDSLLSKNVAINAQDKNGWTALMYAAKTNKEVTMNSLKKAGAMVNLKNKEGKTAEMIAAEYKEDPFSVHFEDYEEYEDELEE